MFTQRITYEELRSLDSADFTGDYQAVGDPLLYPASIIRIVNASTELVTISIDGVNDYDVVPSDTFCLYDITTNTPNSTNGIFFPAYTQFFVSGSAGTGLVYIVVLYIIQV